MAIAVEIKGLPKLKRAFEASPETFLRETRDFLVRAAAEVRRVIWNDPWRVAGPPGGVPVAYGQLKQSHRTIFGDFEVRIGPDQTVAPYAAFVHEGTSKMEARPWLVEAEKSSRPKVNELARDTIKRITEEIAR